MRKLTVALATLLLVVFAGTTTAPAKAVQSEAQDTAKKTYLIGAPGEPITVTVQGSYVNLTRPTTTYTTCTGYTYSGWYWGWQSYTYSCPQTTNWYQQVFVHIEAASEITGAKVNGRAVSTKVMRRYVVNGIGYQVVRIGAQQLFYNDRAEYTLSYKLYGGAPRSSEASRVGAAYTYFCPGGTGKDGGSVTVQFPTGYTEITALGDGYTRTESGGGATFATGEVSNAFQLFSCIEAVNPAMYSVDSFTSRMGTTIELRGWPGDFIWMSNAKKNLPKIVDQLEDFTGVPLNKGGRITVREASVAGELRGFYGGLYTEGIARISEKFDDMIAAHELAHVWFNSENIKDNWAFEGITQYVAERALVAAGGEIGDKPCSEGWSFDYTKSEDPDAQPKLLEWEYFSPGDSTQADSALTNRIDKRYFQACAAVSFYLFGQPAAEQRWALSSIAAGISPVDATSGNVLSTRNVLDVLAMTTQDLDGNDRGLTFSNSSGFAPLTKEDQARLSGRAEALRAYKPIWHAFVKAGWKMPIALSQPISAWEFNSLKAAVASVESAYTGAGVAALENAPSLIKDNLAAAGFVPGLELDKALSSMADPALVGAEIGNLMVASDLIRTGHELLLAGVDPVTAIGGFLLNPQGGINAAAGAALTGDGATALTAAESAAAAIGNRTLVGALALLLVLGALFMIRRRRMHLASVGSRASVANARIQLVGIKKRLQKSLFGRKKRSVRTESRNLRD